MLIETTSIKNELFYDSLYVSCETYIYRIDLDYSIYTDISKCVSCETYINIKQI